MLGSPILITLISEQRTGASITNSEMQRYFGRTKELILVNTDSSFMDQFIPTGTAFIASAFSEFLFPFSLKKKVQK